MLDSENGSIHFTGIYKCLGNKKVDVAALSADPMFADSVRKIRGGSLRIQGTWSVFHHHFSLSLASSIDGASTLSLFSRLPYEAAMILSSRIAFEIRNDLVPLFGPGFPDVAFDSSTLSFLHL
jgi:hypothetical protein